MYFFGQVQKKIRESIRSYFLKRGKSSFCVSTKFFWVKVSFFGLSQVSGLGERTKMFCLKGVYKFFLYSFIDIFILIISVFG